MIRVALMVSVAFYAGIGEALGSKLRLAPSPILLYVFTLVAVMDVVFIFVLRRVLVLPVQGSLSGQATAPAALNRWRAGYIATYALSEAIGLFGLVLRIVGFGLAQAGAFYLGAMVLLLFFNPSMPPDEIA